MKARTVVDTRGENSLPSELRLVGGRRRNKYKCQDNGRSGRKANTRRKKMILGFGGSQELKLLIPLQLKTRFGVQNYLDLVWGGVRGL